MEHQKKHWTRTITFKMAVIAFLALLMLIPTNMIEDIIRDRAQLQEEVVAEIEDKWGGSQTLSGPILTIPYRVMHRNARQEESYVLHHAQFMPSGLEINGRQQPKILQRNLYQALLYETKLQFTGRIPLPEIEPFLKEADSILWEQATLHFGVSDLRGISEAIQVKVNGVTKPAQPGIRGEAPIANGFSVPLHSADLKDSPNLDFSIDLQIRGSKNLHFIPTGTTTQVKLAGAWGSPKFNGAFLPVERLVQEQDYRATWQVLEMNREFPQQWKTGREYNLADWSFGVELIFSLNPYQKSLRAIKYAIMFIGLTFLVLFFTELLLHITVHPFQYALVAFSLLVFYLLLLSLSEYLGFNWAYGIAAIATTLINTLYGKSLMGKQHYLSLFGILVCLYLFLFTVLQMEDYALLIGSIGLFIAVSLTMYLSRKITWPG